MQAVIVAGGRGSRLHPDGKEPLPKPLMPVAGLPMLEHILGWLGPQGVTNVVLCTGYRAADIETALGSGERYGMRIVYSVEQAPLGTAGAVKAASAHLRGRFLVVYADVLADVSIAGLIQAHAQSRALATLAVHPNDHPLDSDRVVTDSRGYIIGMVRKEEKAGPDAGALCNAAFYLVEKSVLDAIPDDGRPRDFARDVFPSLVRSGQRLFAWRTTEYLKDMGTPQRLMQVESDVRGGVPYAMRRSTPRPAALLDRDGVLLDEIPFLKHKGDVRLLDSAAHALKRLNESQVLALCCTNQPVIARGEVTDDELHGIHQRMEGLIGQKGAWLDGIFVCPHHPDAGFAGERAELKVACDCRKPMPGLIHHAQSALNVDLQRSIFVGDRSSDVLAARRAGVLPVGVLTGTACKDGKHPIAPETPLLPDVLAAVELMLGTTASWEPFLDEIRAARVVLLGGASRVGKTTAANGLVLALRRHGVPVMHLSLDRWIEPATKRLSESTLVQRTRFDEAARDIVRLSSGEPVLAPGYDPHSREATPAEMLHWGREGVLIVDGLLALRIAVPGALRIALHAPPSVLEERRSTFYAWKGLEGRALFQAVHGRSEEHQVVASSLKDAQLHLSLDKRLVLQKAS